MLPNKMYVLSFYLQMEFVFKTAVVIGFFAAKIRTICAGAPPYKVLLKQISRVKHVTTELGCICR